MVDFDVIVVVYNRPIQKIAGLQAFLTSQLVKRVVICDNSTSAKIATKNMVQAENLCTKARYISMGGNKGLAKAYNRGLGECSSEFVAIFDDDTIVPTDFFEKTNEYCEHGAADIYLPIVRSSRVIMSPCIKEGFSFRAARDIDELGGNVTLSAINSGMVVRRSFYTVCGYDERLFVDNIDHRFMDQAREAKASIVIMRKVQLRQDFSQEIYDEEKQCARFKIRAQDCRIYYGDSSTAHRYCSRWILRCKFALARKYKNPKILFMRV